MEIHTVRLATSVSDKPYKKSKNVCTIRVLDEVNLESIFDIAGPRLRIGYDIPVQSRTHISSDERLFWNNNTICCSRHAVVRNHDQHPVHWIRANPKTIKMVKRLLWTLPKVCLDEPVSKQGEEWCHSCDVNLRVCDWLPIAEIPETDPCVDARLMGKRHYVPYM